MALADVSESGLVAYYTLPWYLSRQGMNTGVLPRFAAAACHMCEGIVC